MASLYRDENGNFRARRKLPRDVREEYGGRHGPRYEAKFFRPASIGRHEAERQFKEWSAEIDGQIIALRAARDGSGLTLTPAQARRLAGDWYEWWVARHAGSTSARQIDEWGEAVHDAIYSGAVSQIDAERLGPDDLWRDREDVRQSVRPVLADIGETAQFLAAKRMGLTNAAQNLFLDCLYEDVAAALKRIERLSRGDHSPDKYVERFPKAVEARDSGITPWGLFERWVEAKKPAHGTVENWKYMLRALDNHFEGRSAASILPEEAEVWLSGQVTPTRSAHTVKNTWFKAVNTVFGWAAKKKLVAPNPFVEAADALTLPKRQKLRETDAFLPAERTKILAAALQRGGGCLGYVPTQAPVRVK
jgi:hypothetical protein